MARTQQDREFVKPTVTPKPVDLSKVDFDNASLYDKALLDKIEKLQARLDELEKPKP